MTGKKFKLQADNRALHRAGEMSFLEKVPNDHDRRKNFKTARRSEFRESPSYSTLFFERRGVFVSEFFTGARDCTEAGTGTSNFE